MSHGTQWPVITERGDCKVASEDVAGEEGGRQVGREEERNYGRTEWSDDVRLRVVRKWRLATD